MTRKNRLLTRFSRWFSKNFVRAKWGCFWFDKNNILGSSSYDSRYGRRAQYRAPPGEHLLKFSYFIKIKAIQNLTCFLSFTFSYLPEYANVPLIFIYSKVCLSCSSSKLLVNLILFPLPELRHQILREHIARRARCLRSLCKTTSPYSSA